MYRWRLPRTSHNGIVRFGAVTIAFALSLGLYGVPVQAATLLNRHIALGNANKSATTSYDISFRWTVTNTLGSVQVLICANSPLENDTCVAPAGFSLANAILVSQAGPGDFGIYSQSANSIVFSRTPSSITAPVDMDFTLHNVVNPSSAGSYYGRITTYSSADATGARLDFGGLAFAINENFQISTYVPPFILFCSGITISGYDCTTASGNYINLGELSTKATRSGQSQLLVATNAASGYTIQAGGTTLVSGNNVITNLTTPAASAVGTSQFGINLRKNSQPSVGDDPTGPGLGEPTASYNIPNDYLFNPNDIVAQSLNADDYRKYTVSYIANMAPGQAPGIYVSTITYVCTGSF